MDVHNLAIMFGPTLVRPQDSSILVMARDNADQCRIVESIISHVIHAICLNIRILFTYLGLSAYLYVKKLMQSDFW